MPDIDGIQLCNLLIFTYNIWINQEKLSRDINRKAKMNKICPIVAITAYTDISIYKKAIDAGIKRVIHKPIDINVLISVLDEFYPAYRKRLE